MITDLGPDFRKKKGVVLYSGCSCTCCCCCVHTVVSSYFFIRAFSRASEEISKRRLGTSVWVGIVVAPLLAWLAGIELYGGNNPRADPATVSLWTFLLLGPVLLPILAFVSWVGGVLGIAFESVFFDGNFSAGMEGLSAAYSNYFEAFFNSIVWVLIVVVLCILALTGMRGC
jgi:hypothetical protein